MASSVVKTLARIKGTVESGAYYEAQQMYKTSFHRCKAKQQLDDAMQILQEGATTQLAHNQITCGVELGMLLLEAYASVDVRPDTASASRLLSIIRAFPPPPSPAAGASAGSQAPSTSKGSSSPVVDECARFVATAVKWAHKGGDSQSARRIHSAFASYLWKSFGAESFGRALPHFVRGCDADEFAEALHTCAAQGPASEVDLWLLRAMLQVLTAASSQRSDGLVAYAAYARAVFGAFTSRCGSALDTPTAHFTELVLLAVNAITSSPSAHQLLQLAKDRYGDAVLRRDQSFDPMLERLEAVYFNVRKGGAGGPFGGLLGGLLKSLAQAH
ncbi:hypothetical protein GPECTOR_82g245 [Gonium pectorale]|uniref:Golgi to ER traffic protein 4 n=1 Tax=Gonium pectorale TaxID=33097 RepID=A0A150G1M4_GONPE|nr:hypothetical protein GPECTOR_82g245 [Gonium pectorale]|eukprot:KXZ43711.1 hypothetical protein GPECTOR_82g245 [Gonium pectorale]